MAKLRTNIGSSSNQSSRWRHRLRLGAVYVALVGLGGFAGACGGVAGSDSPERAARSFIKAAEAGEPDGIRSRFPGRAQLNTAMQCRAGEGLHDRVADEVKGLLRELPTVRKWRNFKSISESERKTVAKGETYKGCEAQVQMVFWQGTITFEIAERGGLEEGSETLRMVQLGNEGWFILSI
jgi:hypothetical protein